LKNTNIQIAPSVLSADFTRLREEIKSVEKGGADWLHLDIMDGHFVPNITFGPMLIKSIRTLTHLPLDTHLMIQNPDDFLEEFKDAGCDRLTVHVETCFHLHRTIENIQRLGMRAGVALNPATPASMIKEVLPYVDLVLVMTVNPGFGGQKFIRSMFTKIAEIADMISAYGNVCYLEVDGGVDVHNASQLSRAGANVLVAGHSIFSKKNIVKAIQDLREAASKE
jgi:ribulose-phosphate 3-epimerase